ncbi:MAG: ADP-forming succinate--CoA ligase subunit beta [bacterium]|nr:ADP-forming succinate--CoA ligase subunit beta [bacterium]
MDLLEYQGKRFLADYGVPVPKGGVAESAQEAVAWAEGIGYPVAVKAQVHIGGRGKAGGIVVAANPTEVRSAAERILGMDIRGQVVKCLLIEKGSEIEAEYYAGFTLDRSAGGYLGMLSAQGGVDIEAVAETAPEAISRILVNPVEGLTEATIASWVRFARIDDRATHPTIRILSDLYAAFVHGDADLIEINPLVLTSAGEVLALDAKVTLDSNSVFRHPNYQDFDATQPRDDREAAAHSRGLQYVGLDGTVGVIANGAGLAMSTVDVIAQAGGAAANFLDIGGAAEVETMASALEVINNDPRVKVIFINIFGGIVQGDVVARGILAALDRVKLRSPIVLRLDGTNAAEGRAMIGNRLSERLVMADSMPDGAMRAVEIAGRT